MVQIKRVFGAAARAALASLLICLASGQAWAESARAWLLETQSGQVHLVKTGIAPIALTPGDVFAGGDWIETGPDGRAVLRRGEETIVVAPNSRIGLPKDNSGPFATRILHTLGTILLTVEKKAKQHFEVQAPYLVAVVKGTTFTVSVQDGRALVHVVEGLVQVRNLASGRSSLVRPGQTGAVVRGAADVQMEGGDPQGAPAESAASQIATDSETSIQPAANTASEAASAVPAVENRANAGVIRIKVALGPKTLNLNRLTGGMIRAARDDTHGKLSTGILDGTTGVILTRADGAGALAVSSTSASTSVSATSVSPLSSASALSPVSAPLATAVSPLSSAPSPSPFSVVSGEISQPSAIVPAPIPSLGN